MTFAGTTTTAEFVSGTTKAIPANTTGSLDAGNAAELSFHYGKSVFTLPYKNITYTEVTEPVSKHLLHVPVPKLGKGTRFLNISYREGGSSRMLTFKASATGVAALEATINERRKDPRQAPPLAIAGGGAPTGPSVKTDPEVWWGDKYWRTTRNKPKWPEAPADSPSAPSGTKE